MFCIRDLVAVFVVMGLFAADAAAADLCKAIALRDVGAVESPTSVIHRGSYDGAITQYRFDKSTRTTSFCSHGGYCYPTHINIDGNMLEALKLVNCKIGATFYDYGTFVIYSIDLIRSSASSQELRSNDLGRKFLEMGLSSACADNVAQYYIHKPNSACSDLAKKALEGDPIAENALKVCPDYCQFWPPGYVSPPHPRQ